MLMMASQRELRDAFLLASRLALARGADGGGADPAVAPGAPPRVPEIVFSAEFFCHPDPNRSSAYPREDRQYADFPYLNSGTYVGRAGSIRYAMDRFPNCACPCARARAYARSLARALALGARTHWACRGA